MSGHNDRPGQRPARAVESPDDEGVVVWQVVMGLGEAWSPRPGSSSNIPIEPQARSPVAGDLQEVEALFTIPDAGVPYLDARFIL
jgi:hypothetical protein